MKSSGSVKILSVGNSFSVDATAYLCDILKAVGYSDVTLGNLYIGGCSLETHAKNLSAPGTKPYVFYYCRGGEWENSGEVNIRDVVNIHDWDVVTLQQASHFSGMPETFDPWLGILKGYIKDRLPSARIAWHMTWAYQRDFTGSTFAGYGFDQDEMYRRIIGAVRGRIMTAEDIDFIIPAGTAIQNMRSGSFGDDLTRDGFHLSVPLGRFAAGLVWARAVSGNRINELPPFPLPGALSPEEGEELLECIENAFASPFEVS